MQCSYPYSEHPVTSFCFSPLFPSLWGAMGELSANDPSCICVSVRLMSCDTMLLVLPLYLCTVHYFGMDDEVLVQRA